MTQHIIGLILIDAPFSALNNAGPDVGARADNTTLIKSIRKGKDEYPYVSAQAVRYWWRNVLADQFAWKLSPITRETKIAFTEANPFLYPDDDIFGYMRAPKSQGKKKEKKDVNADDDKDKKTKGTLTRMSVLKNSPLISILPQKIIDDFGVMARNEGNPVPFEHQFYSAVLKGIFAIDTTNAGKFHKSQRAGYANITDDYEKTEDIKKAIKETGATYNAAQQAWVLPKEVRNERIRNVISAIPFLHGGAKQTLHHTDVTPKFIVICKIDGGNNIFMNIVQESSKDIFINIGAFKEMIIDYRERITSDIYIGINEGFGGLLKENLVNLQKDINDNSRETGNLHIFTPKQAVEAFTKTITT